MIQLLIQMGFYIGFLFILKYYEMHPSLRIPQKAYIDLRQRFIIILKIELLCPRSCSIFCLVFTFSLLYSALGREIDSEGRRGKDNDIQYENIKVLVLQKKLHSLPLVFYCYLSSSFISRDKKRLVVNDEKKTKKKTTRSENIQVLILQKGRDVAGLVYCFMSFYHRSQTVWLQKDI